MAVQTDNDVITLTIHRSSLRVLCLLGALLFVWSERAAFADMADGFYTGYEQANAAHR